MQTAAHLVDVHGLHLQQEVLHWPGHDLRLAELRQVGEHGAAVQTIAVAGALPPCPQLSPSPLR